MHMWGRLNGCACAGPGCVCMVGNNFVLHLLNLSDRTHVQDVRRAVDEHILTMCCFVAEHIGETSEQLCTWLMSASLYQARNSYSINPFRKDEDTQVTEIDGTPCRNFFTILNLGLCIYSSSFVTAQQWSPTFKPPQNQETLL